MGGWLLGIPLGSLLSTLGFAAGALLASRKNKDPEAGQRWAQGFASGQIYALKEAEDAMWAYSMKLRETQTYIPRSQEWFLGFEWSCAKLSEYVKKVTTEDDTPDVGAEVPAD
jgi:hypothetical protein